MPITDLLTQATNTSRPSPTTLTAIKGIGASSISCGTLTGWPTTTAVHFVLYTIDTTGAKVAGSQTDWKGVVSGSTITNLTLKAGSDTSYSIGTVVEATPTAAWANDVVAWGTAHANQDGTLKTLAVQSALNLGTSTLDGWNPLTYTPNTVVANGNRSYTLTFNSVDLTDRLSNGMRLKATRTVTAPTQCTLLNGTTQYFSKSAPAGMTGTTGYSFTAIVKPASYQTGMFESRFSNSGTNNGWTFYMNASGQIVVTGWNANNHRTWTTYQSIPLNKWSAITARLDMTSTATSGVITIDGVDVPVAYTTTGSPTVWVNAGNYEVGTSGSGLNPFSGKLAQIAAYSALITQATMVASQNQGLSGAEATLISAYSFNNSITDLNTTNANNLTAVAGAVATNADSPFGQQADGTTLGTTDYGIITKTAFSTNTTLTVQVPEGNTIPTSGGISAVAYSSVKVPYGFIGQKRKWRISTLMKAQASQSSATISTWYNLSSLQIALPIGEWEAIYSIKFYTGTTSGNADVYGTLSTSNSTETDPEWTIRADGSNIALPQGPQFRTRDLAVTTSTNYYILTKYVTGGAPVTIFNLHDQSEGILEVVCSYL